MNRLLSKLTVVAALATASALAQTPAATPQPGAPPTRHRLWARLRPGKVARALNLTDSQKQQAKTIFQQARQTAQPVRQQLQQNRQALVDAVKTGKTTADIQQLAAQQGTLMGQMVAIRTQAWAQFYNLLTPDQRTQADQLR